MLQKKIMIIDDEKGYCEVLEMIFRHQGYEVASETCPTQGIRTAKAINPDLIILDMLMPELNGWQVIKHLEEQDETAGVPIVLMSALPSDRMLMEEGAIIFTDKIVNFSDLVVQINQIIEQDSPAQRVARSRLRQPLAAKNDLSLSLFTDWMRGGWLTPAQAF